MKVRVGQFTPYGPAIVVALVDSQYTLAPAGSTVLDILSKWYPTQAIMLVSVEDNGFRAYATFETARLLALLQLEEIELVKLDLSESPRCDDELPF